jgi:DNA-directed RNA polymerase subunit RPC12/RpoP
MAKKISWAKVEGTAKFRCAYCHKVVNHCFDQDTATDYTTSYCVECPHCFNKLFVDFTVKVYADVRKNFKVVK